MPLLKRIRTIAAKVESVIGTAESLTASEGSYNAFDIEINVETETEKREGQGSFDYLSSVSGPRWGTMSFKTDIGWDGTVTMPTWATVLLTGCGIVETSQVYTPRSEAPGGAGGVKTLTLGVFENGLYKLLAGAVGNVKLTFPTGKLIQAEWEFQGVWQDPTDTAIIAPTYPTAAPLRFANTAALTWASTGSSDILRVAEVTLDAGNQITKREDALNASGYVSGIITDREPTITASPESELVAVSDYYGDLIANTEGAFALTLDGPSTSTIAIAAPAAQIMSINEGDRDKLQVDDIEWSCNKNGATLNNAFSITFAETV